MKKLLSLLLIFGLCLVSSKGLAWDGYDSENVVDIEIDSGNLVRPGETIEVYDSDRGYIDVDVENISTYGGTTEIEVYDSDTGEYRTFEMED